MFPDSKIAQKYGCGRTKATHIFSGAIAKESIENLKSSLNSSDLCICYGSSDENDRFLSILIRHFGSDGLVHTSLLDMPDIDKGSDAQTMFETCKGLLNKPSLLWENCCIHSSDSTSSMVGKNKSLLKLIKDAQSETPQKIYDVGCPCQLAHLCAQKGAKALSMQVDYFVIDLFYHFKKSVKRNATLRDCMEFTNTEIMKVVKHVTTLWLSLGKSLDRGVR